MPQLDNTSDDQPTPPRQPPRWNLLPRRALPAAIAAVAAMSAATTVILLLIANTTTGDRAALQLDAVKTGLTVGAGTGGILALLLALRRQTLSEHAQIHSDYDADQRRTDALERRITELYTKAADQLGSDKAPVRLAGLYALERLAQDNPAHRQTIVNVICAYLRMPYTPPPTTDAPDTDEATRTRHDQARQELQVRLTAQTILTRHLHHPANTPPPTYWPTIDIDLTNAHLTDFDMGRCKPDNAQFRGATFSG